MSTSALQESPNDETHQNHQPRHFVPGIYGHLTYLERILQIAISFTFFWLYAIFVFLLYMAKEGFFSYDLFATGGFGISVFFITAELQVALISLSTFGWIGLIKRVHHIAGSSRTLENKSLAFMLVAINVALTSIIVFSSTMETGEKALLLALLFSVALYLIFLLIAKTRKIWKAMLFLFITMTSISLTGSPTIVNLLHLGLKTYGIGGGLKATAHYQGGTATGSLILLGPDNAYLRMEAADNESFTLILPRNSLFRLDIHKNAAPIKR